MSPTRPPYEEYMFAGLGMVFVAFSNIAKKIPVVSRIYLYPLAAAAGFGVGRVASNINEKRIADRELAIWDYVRRHPDDFPELSPKKFKEVLEPWHPIR